MRALLRYVLFFLMAVPIGFLLLYPQLLRCLRIDQSADFQTLSGVGNVFVRRTATPAQQTTLRSHVLTARERIRQFWGERRGQPVLIYCPQQADYERYCLGGEGAGCSLGLPWGSSYLVLGPDGNNPDVIAHELCHDELFARLGWWRVKRQIPVWFNEGLALMVDYRFTNPAVWEKTGEDKAGSSRFDEDDWPLAAPRQLRPLAELETSRDFFGGDYRQVMLAYQTAADEVSRWLSVAGTARLPTLINDVANGSEFGETYRQLERSERIKKRRP